MTSAINDRRCRATAGRRRGLSLIFGVALSMTISRAAQGAVQAIVKTAPRSLIPLFSAMMPGAFPGSSGWVHQPIKGLKPNVADLVTDGQQTVLRIQSDRSGSAWAHPLAISGVTPKTLRWRWSVHGAPARSVLGDKSADDFAARLYLIFDYPLDKLPWSQRLAIELARTFTGQDIPAAAICYVWHPAAKTDTLIDSPYTARVKMIVARGGATQDQWSTESRNLGADFQRAFGDEYGPGVAPLKAVAVSADTDQTGGIVTAFFGDIRLDG